MMTSLHRTRPGRPVAAKCLCGLAAVAGALAVTLSCPAQLAPKRACALLKQPIEATLALPPAPAAPPAGDPIRPTPAPGAAPEPPPADEPIALSVELIDPASGHVIQTRGAPPGVVDLAKLFPRLWTTESPEVLYAQALAGKQRIGAPMVLVPMVSPRYAPRVDRDGLPVVTPIPPGSKPRVLAGYWVYLDQRIEFTTSKGRLLFALRPDAAPVSAGNFRGLVAKGFYDGIPVHRIASLSGRTLPDIVQFGDPTGTGQGGPGYYIDYEPSPLRHGFGTLSYARTSDPNSAGSQVLICLGREGGSGGQLDGRYTVFGHLITGAETLAAIAKTPVDADGRPREPLTIESARLVDAPPFGGGPKPDADPFARPTGR